jgi:hypothetical protein
MDMKAKEKGIDMSAPQKDRPRGDGGRGFNAFRELKYEAKNSKRGGRDDRKPRGSTDDLSISYEGQKYKITPEGKLEEPESLVYKKNGVLAFEGVGDGNFDFQAVKARGAFVQRMGSWFLHRNLSSKWPPRPSSSATRAPRTASSASASRSATTSSLPSRSSRSRPAGRTSPSSGAG